MKCLLNILIVLGFFSCNPNPEIKKEGRTGNFSGIFKNGNFSDKILFEIERDCTRFNVFFTSLEQNANRIPFQNVEVKGDSINFELQSDFYKYSFRNKWTGANRKLQGTLTVDTVTTSYSLEKELLDNSEASKSEEVSFDANGLRINGTIWYPETNQGKALVIVTSSGNSDRSASRAEAILFAQKGFTTFHYDKRGTGNSEGDWNTATMDDLVADDIAAISYFSNKTGIPLKEIGVKGSSQGATKVPYVLGELEDLKYGIAVSCPGVNLLESDLNYWKNRNAEVFGDDMEAATQLQRKVFEYIAGDLPKTDLEQAIEHEESKSWFHNVWVPNLEEVQTDKKLLYTPIPHFETTKQPILIIQGTLDEIIPPNSHLRIEEALQKSSNDDYQTVLLDGASHSMYYVGESDFPYWSKLHPDYLPIMENWIHSVYKD